MVGMIWDFAKTTILFAVHTDVLLAASYATRHSPLVAIALATLLNSDVYWFSYRMALAITEPTKVSETEHPEPHAIVRVDRLRS